MPDGTKTLEQEEFDDSDFQLRRTRPINEIYERVDIVVPEQVNY